MTKWESEEVLNKWLQKGEKEGKHYVEEHVSEMGDEMDAAFHHDLIRLLEMHGVNTDALSMDIVGILNALEKLMAPNEREIAMLWHPKVQYQLVYLGPEGLPEFLDIHAKNEEEAEEKASDWVIRNRDDLRTQNNFVVSLMKVLKEFGVPSPSDD